MTFSEKYGFKTRRAVFQIDSIDDDLKNSLWSILEMQCWSTAQNNGFGYYLSPTSNKQLRGLCIVLWLEFFKLPIDEIDTDWLVVKQKIRDYYFKCNWFEIYDLIEFIANNFMRPNFKIKFQESCNLLLEKEMSAYRFISGVICRITDKNEIGEISEASQNKLDSVQSHIQRSIELLSDKNSPDYRNSIKESVSAVESLVRHIVKDQNSSLGKLLNKLESETNLHPSLKSAITKLYGYSSDEGGIRHALIDQDKNDFQDAKFMLVICSSFINFVEGKIK